MALSRTAGRDEAREFAFLCVDDFLSTLVDARALKAALELRLIDLLLEKQPCTPEELERALAADGRGLRLLVGLLRANRVVEQDAGKVRLTAAFREALRYRDLLEAKLDFADLVAPDVLELFTALIADPGRF